MVLQSLIKILSLGLLLSHARTALAYIPAQATNDSSALTHSDDLLHLAYYNGPFSVFTADVARQLLAEGFGDDGNYTNTTTIVPWTRFSKGVLLHFDETLRSQPPAAVPWLAMINCDTNGTSYSDVDDIFTICRDLGAQAAVLYSLTSQGCLINSEYLADFEKVLDVYATTTLQNARILENQFGNVNSSAWEYDSAALNSSATLIEALLANNALSVVGNVPINATNTDNDADDSNGTETLPDSDTSSIPPSTSSGSLFGGSTSVSTNSLAVTAFPTSSALRRMRRQASATGSVRRTSTRTSATPTKTSLIPTVAINYLGAVVAARNLTVGGLSSAAPTPSPSSNSNDGPNTGLAMIILYSITGVVTFLFFTVILCGAVRAIRYPERYGPRAGFGYGNRASGSGPNGGAQNRAQGLARAVLDTFPIVRFGGGGTAAASGPGRNDEEQGKGGDGDSQKDGGKAEVDDVELLQLAPTLSAVPKRASASAGRTREEEIEEIEGASTQPTLRASTSLNSFHSTLSTPSLPVGTSDPSLGVLSVIGAPNDSSGTAMAPGNLDSTTNLLPAPVPQTSTSTAPLVRVPLASSSPPATEDEDQLSCPICVCEFTEGDSIRILPCDARHQFHVECIDPWLLGVSRLCPLCRLDLGESHEGQNSAAGATGGRGGGGGGGTEEAGPEDSERDREARERERERHEEERVVRHLRGLLHRGSTSTSTSGPSAIVDSTSRRRTRSDSTNATGDAFDSQARETVGLRSRFAKYVAVRRRRRENSSSSSPPNGTAPTPR